MARQTLDSKYICSIYPAAPPVIKKYVGLNPSENSPRCTRFMLPAVPKNGKPQWDHKDSEPDLAKVMVGNGWATLEVSDCFENVEDHLNATRRKKKFNSRLISCESMIKNLMQEWAGNMVGVPAGVGPGIMEIANSSPTSAELEAMHRMQNAFFEHMFAEGERHSAAGEPKEITLPMITAAEWFDRRTRWANTAFVKMIPCPHCKQDIQPDQAVCHVCHRDIAKKDAAPASVAQDIVELRKQIAELMAQKTSEPSVATAPASKPVQPIQPLAPKVLPTERPRASE